MSFQAPNWRLFLLGRSAWLYAGEDTTSGDGLLTVMSKTGIV